MSKSQKSKKPRWTKEQDLVLLQGISSYGHAWLMRKTGRTQRAIMSRAGRVFSSGITRGTTTLHGLMVRSGYSKTQILRAQKALHQRWLRTARRGSYLITDEQVDDILDWLKYDYWSKAKGRYCCLHCATKEIVQCALGLCRPCYLSYRKRCRTVGLPVRYEEQVEYFQEIKHRLPVNIQVELEKQFAAKLALTRKQIDALAERDADDSVI